MNMQKFLAIIMELQKFVNDTIEQNDLIFDIDWQGTKQLSKYKNLKIIKIYLITDNKKELKSRLIKEIKILKMKLRKDLTHSMKILNTGMIMIILS